MYLKLNLAVVNTCCAASVSAPQHQALPDNTFNFSAEVNPCWHSQVTRSDVFLLSHTLLFLEGEEKSLPGLIHHLPLSPSRIRDAASVPSAFYWMRNLSASRVDRKEEKRVLRTTGEIGHINGNQIKVSRERRNIFQVWSIQALMLWKMGALSFTFLQRLYFHRHTFGRPEITMSASTLLSCLPKWVELSTLHSYLWHLHSMFVSLKPV